VTGFDQIQIGVVTAMIAAALIFVAGVLARPILRWSTVAWRRAMCEYREWRAGRGSRETGVRIRDPRLVPSPLRRSAELRFARLWDEWQEYPREGWAGVSLWYESNARVIKHLEDVAERIGLPCRAPTDDQLRDATYLLEDLLASIGRAPDRP
jgi:hypothetical protein